MMLTKIDEINALNTRAIPYDEYFGAMELNKEQKERRKEIAEKIETTMLFLFSLLTMYEEYHMEINTIYIANEVQKKYMDILKDTIEGLAIADSLLDTVNTYLNEYTRQFAENVTRTTVENQDKEYYTSQDRAMYVAENEANTSANYLEYEKAVFDGKTKKKWIDKRDKRERKTHMDVGGETIGINDVFLVGNSLMLFPKDTSMGAEAKEIVNCRCTIKYI